MAVRSFLHYALEVPDQAVGQRYYEDFGLVDVTGGDKAVRLKPARQDRESLRQRVRRQDQPFSGRVPALDFPAGCLVMAMPPAGRSDEAARVEQVRGHSVSPASP